MENQTLLNKMSETINKEIYGYGKPDGSNYHEYMLSPGEKYYQEIINFKEVNFLEDLLCWSMFEAVNIHNTESRIFEKQQDLEKRIIKKASNYDESINAVKYNIQLLRYMHDFAKDKLDPKIQHFISYCMFADKEYILNGNAYWRQINLAVLERVYLEALSFNKDETWNFPSTFFITNGSGPIPFGPDYTQGPEYSWNYKENRLEAQIYLPMSDQYRVIVCAVNPVAADISLSEACDWVHLDFIIKKEIDNITFPRVYVSPKPMSARRGIDNLFSLIFGDIATKKTKKELDSFVVNIYNDLFWLWTGDIPKPEFGYIESKPALVYCLYRAIRFLSHNSLNYVFNFKHERFLENEFLKFKELEEKEAANLNTPFYLQMSEYHLHNQEKRKVGMLQSRSDEDKLLLEKKNQEILEEKYSILQLMMFFFLWDIAKNLPAEPFISQENLVNYLCHEHGDLMEKFYDALTDETWNKEPLLNCKERECLKRMNTTWTNKKVWVELINLILERYKINTRITKLNLSDFSADDISSKSEVLKTLLFFFSDINSKSKDSLLNMMDYLGELKDKKELYCQPKQGQKFKSDVPANEEISRMKENQNVLKQKDCGFEMNHYVQVPVPSGDVNIREYILLRKLTCRFFSDTDKEYKYSVKDNNKKNFSIKCFENYRETNKNNLYCKSLYVSERNTARHYVDAFSVRNVLDDSFPSNLLEAFRDAKDYLFELRESKKNDSSQKLLVEYQIDFLQRHFVTYIEKYNLLEKKEVDKNSIWDEIFTNDKKIRENIKQKLPDYGDYQSVLGRDYLDEVRWFFKLLYCADSSFIELYYPSLTAYLTYLCLRLEDCIM